MSQTQRKLWRGQGGIHLPEHKQISTQLPSGRLPLPAHFIIPLLQHSGDKPDIAVQVGEYVYKGQPLAIAHTNQSVPVHAPTSGTITAIEPRTVPHPSGLQDMCVVLAADGKDDWGSMRLPQYPDYPSIEAATLRAQIKLAGVVGMGGAVFPSAVKLNVRPTKPIQTLLINGAECEPYITCDDLLMREKAEEIVAGIQVMLHIVQPQECLIGIEDNKPEAIAAMQAAVAATQDQRIQVVPIPTVYPSGSAKQLTYILTGKEVPNQGRSSDIGVLCNNVGTAHAIYQAIVKGEPSLTRYVTVTGNAISQPQNFEVLFGTPLEHVLQHAGGITQADAQVSMGGPMMPLPLPNPQTPIVKATNCLLVRQPEPVLPAQACIRCGRCSEVCPSSLLPQQLYWFAKGKEFDKAEQHHLFACIECACCAYVCPSHIPLVNYYRYAKDEIRAQRANKKAADQARERHEFRLERQERLKREKAEKLAKHKANVQQQSADTPADDPKKAAIQAALERAKAKKAAAQAQEGNA